MKSRFKYGAYIVLVLSTVFSILLCCSLAAYLFPFGDIIPIALYIILNIYFIFVWLWLAYGELRTKAVAVNIGYDNFSARQYFGIAAPKTYYFSEVEGYKISILPAKGAEYEYLYIIAGGKKAIKLSQFYHSNYHELKEAITAAGIKDLGYENFSYGREVKEIFA